MTLPEALALAAPYYNLALVIVAILLFIKLFSVCKEKGSRNTFILPWKILFWAVIIFVLEEVFTILRAAGILNIPAPINGFFELAIIILFIYLLLLQKQYVLGILRKI